MSEDSATVSRPAAAVAAARRQPSEPPAAPRGPGLPYRLMALLAWAVGKLPPRGVDALARTLAFLVYDVLRVRRRLVAANLERAFGAAMSDAERTRVGRASVYHFALTVLEFVRGFRGDLVGHVELQGAQHLRRALEEGRGCYFVAAHLGNWEALAAATTRLIAPTYVLVKKVGGPSMDRFVTEVRERNGFLPIKRRGMGDGYRAIKAALGRGEAVGFVMDQARPGEPRLPFFGTPAKTNTSLAAIWRRMPAPVLSAHVRRVAPFRHVIEYGPPLALAATDDKDADVKALSARFNEVIEAQVRSAPEQYFWLHDRWK
jgi:KDO2-lipid IV(A) lauroyltransferase